MKMAIAGNFVLVACVGATAAMADMAAISFGGFGGGGFNYTQGTYLAGFEFRVQAAISVTQLGFYDASSNGQPQTFQNAPVGLWDITTNTLLGSVTVTAADPLTGFFRYAALSTPIALNTTDTYAVAGITGTNYYTAGVPPNSSSVVVNAPVVYLAPALESSGESTTLHEPDSFPTAYGFFADFGSNFQFTTANSAPSIASMQNAASNILLGQPNFGIAQGSIFDLYGANFGAAALAEASALPLPTTLAETSVTVTQGNNVFDVPMVFVVNNQAGGYSQLAGVMPSGTTPGSATVQLTYNNVVSNSFETTILANNFGISTVNETGQGVAVVTYSTSSAPFYGLVTRANSAIPGDTYTMWGTGLGAATGGNSDTNASVTGNVGPPVTLLVGGVPAKVTYQGRSPGSGPGLDQINFVIPQNVSGCFVSLVVETSGTSAGLSNNPSIPIAANGGLCSDPAGFPTSTWSPLLALPNGVDVATFQLNQFTGFSEIKAGFFSETQSQFEADYVGFSEPNVNDGPVQASPGSCVIGFSGPNSAGNGATFLDTGSTLMVTPPSGSALSIPASSTGFYHFTGTSTFPAGTYTVTNGSASAGILPISASFTVPPFATWTNQSALANTTVTRANGLTLTWSGSDSSAGSYIDISGGSSIPGSTNGATVTFECVALASAGTFTIPPSALLSLPATGGSVNLSSNFFEPLSIPGFNLAYATGSNSAGVPITWK